MSEAHAPTRIVRQAAVADAEQLAPLATQVFRATYGAVIPEQVLTRYVARTFSPVAFRTMLADRKNKVLVGTIGGKIVGYGKVTAAALPSLPATAPALHLSSLYIEQQYRGHGLGTALMQAALAWAEDQEYATMWLCVWQKNSRARTFYERLGFVVSGETEILVEDVVFCDWVMQRPTIATDRVHPSPTAR